MGSIRDRLLAKEEEKKKNGVKTSGTSIRDRLMTEDRLNEVGSTIQNRIKNWLTNSDDYFKNSSNRYSSRDNSVYGMEDSIGWKDTVTAQKDWFNTEAENINKLLTSYEKYFDKDWVANVRNTLNSTLRNQDAVVNYADGDIKYWSQWKSAEEYEKSYDQNTYSKKYDGYSYSDIQKAIETAEGREKNWLTSNADNYMSSADAQAEIDRLEKELPEYKTINFGYSKDTSADPTEARISVLKTIKNKAELKEKHSAFLKEAEEDPAYIGYVGRGEKRGSQLTEYRNDPNQAHIDSAQALRAGGIQYDSKADKFARNMTDDEYQTYLFFLGKYGEGKANEYLDTIEESINAKESQMLAGTVNNPLEAAFFSAVAGIDQFKSGIESLFSDKDYIPASATQMASGIVRENLKEDGIPYYNLKTGKWEDWDVNIFGSSAGQVMYDAINTTSNMLPSIFASYVANTIVPGSGAYVGTGLLGASSAGHGKAEMLNLGYSKGQANAYGLMVGASEGGLQYLLGGITSLGGNSTGLTQKILSKVDNAFARVAITIGSGMVSEGFEEGLQTVIEPWLKEIATGVDWDSPDIDEVLYSSLLGAISSLGFEGVGAVKGEVQYSNALKNTGKNIVSSTDGYNALKNLANEVSSEGLVEGEANIKSLVEKTQTGVDAINNNTASKHQQNKTYKQVGKLSETLDTVRNEQNLAEIQSSLESKGLSKSEAQRAAQLLNEALYTDGAYSKELYQSVMKDEGVWDTLRELVSSPDSTLKSRNLKHKLGRVGLKVGEDGTIVSSVKAEETEGGYVDESLSFVEDASKREYEVSTDGKSIDNSTGNVIDIVEVVSIKDGQMMLKVKDADGVETEVNAKNVSYANESEALIYEAVAHMGLNAVSANSIVQSYNPTQDAGAFARGIQEAYRYGKYNYSEHEMYQEGNFLLDLTEEQIKKAYKLGQIQSGSDTAVAVAKLKEAIANSTGKKGEGKVHFEGDAVNIDVESLKDQQKVSLKTMEMLSKALGIEFYVYSSYVNKNGERVYKDANGKVKSAPNGVYDKATGAIHIDLNAGENGEGTMLFTIAHELTHFIKAWSPAKFKVLANFLVEQYGKKGVSVETLVRRQMANMKANGRKNVTYDLAFEEFVADSMQTMLTSGNVMESLAEIKRRDEGLWNKIKEFFTDLIEHLKKEVNAYSGFAPDTVEGQTVAEMTDVIEQLEKLFTEGLVDASENFRAISSTEAQTLAEAGIGFDEDTQSVHSLRFSTGRKDALGNVIDLVTVGKKNFNTEAIAQLVAKGTGRSIEDARKWVNSEIAIANIVMNHPEFLDFQADDRYESIKKNSDYPQGTVDLSNLCPKRTEFTAMFDMLQKKYPNKLFTASDVAAMRNILKERGITVACGACFVEDRRQLLGEIADTYIGMWKEAVETGKPLQKTNASGNKITLTVTAALAKQYGLTKGSEILATDKYIPTQYDLTTYEGFKLLEKNHPTIAMGFNRYNNSRGQQAGRLIEGRAEYNRQILGWSPAKIKSVNNNGGLRIFSFSDFEVVHLLDLVQVILDCSAMGVKIQGYTKIPSFARLVRDTGIKINRSLIPKGQTGMKMVDGKQVLDYDTTEGIDINDENFINERDNPNVGNILIGINPTQIGLAMLDDFVDYIIPFHTNKSKDICKALGLAEWVNYKESQHEKDIDTGKASKHNVNIYTEVINKYHPTNKVEFVDAFLKVCKAQKKIPRYSEFLNKEYKADGAYSDEYGSYDFTYREGYHKLLVDFKMFDHNGNILPQGEITPNLDEAFMKELLNAEADKKQNYEFPQEVYDRLDKEFGEAKTTDDMMFSFRKYTDKQRENWKNAKRIVLYENDVQFMDFIKEARTDESFIKKIYFGAIPHDLAVLIKTNTGIDVEDFNCSLSAYEIRKIFNDHGDEAKEAPRGQRAITDGDIVDIPKVIQSPGKIQLSDKQYNGKPVIEFEKQIDGSRHSVAAVVSDKHLDLFVQTAYVGIKKGNLAVPIGVQAPINTPKANNGTVSNIKIAQNPKSVNSSDENSHSDRNKNSVSNRSLLANALESAVTNEFEKKTLAEYKEELDRADALEKELAEIRAKKRELSFAKGRKDTEAINKLRDQEIKTINRIDIRDKKLLRLEATKPLKDIIHREREKAYKRAEKEGKEALAKYREKTAETQRELLNRWQESRHKAVEGRNKTAMRHKIKGVVSELNNLLLHGTKEKHVMIGLQKAVASALDAVNMDTVGAEERVAKYNALIAKEKNPDVIESLTATRDRILAQGNNIGEKLTNLKNAYSEIKNSDDPLIANSYDEVIFSKIEAVVASVKDTPIRDMSLPQLEDVYDLYKMVLTTIRNSNKAFKAKKGEEISVLSNRVMEEVKAVGGKKNRTLKAMEGFKQYGWSILKPVYAFKLIGSKTFSEVFDNVRAGEDTWAKDISEAKDFRTASFKKYNYKNWDFNKKYTFTAKSGTSFELTLEQMLSLYAYSKRKQADDHLEKGGFVFDTAIEVTEKKHGIPLKYKVNTATAHQISKETLAEITGNLSTEQKGFVDEMQDYLSSVMGEKGNEVSLEMYGVKLFKEKFYFPLKSANQFMFEQNDVAGEVKIKNSGFSKETVDHANNPIILNNFMDVWANHVNDMSMYHSFVLALEDFNRVYNYKTPITENMKTESVKEYLQNAYGTHSANYIKQLLTDLNGGARSDPQAGIVNKLLGKFKKAKVFASLSVVIQQPSAIGRAFAYIDPKYFVGKKVNKNEQMKTWSEVKKYAPVAIVKEMGYFDVGNGRSTVSYLKGDKSVMDYVDDVASWLPAKADEVTWCAIWEAVKRETADRNPALKADSEAFLKVAGERFTEVIVNTQVYDSVLSRSGVMRSKDALVKMATAFMAEPTTSANMMIDAHLQGKRGNKKNARKIRGAVATSILINSILVALVYAARDDDEDETYAEKYLGSLTSELLDGFNPLTYLPYIKDGWSILQGYDVERSDMSIFADLVESFEKLFDEDASALDKVTRFTGEVANLFGLPLKNVWRDVEAMFNVANGIIDGTQTTSAGIGYSVMDAVRNAVPIWGRLDSGTSKSDKLYNALLSGNQTQIDRIKGDYKDDKAYESAVKKAIRENDKDVKNMVKAFASGDFTGTRSAIEAVASRYGISESLADEIIDAEYNYYKSKIGEAAEALNEGKTSEYKDIVKTLRERYRGAISQDEIVNAVKVNSQEPKEESVKAEESESVYETWQINSALANGDIDTATTMIEDIVRVKTENYLTKAKAEAEKNGKKFNENTALKEAESKAKSSVKSSITSHWKPLYKEAYKNKNDEEMKRIRYMLKATKLYGTTSELLDTVKGWLKD